MDVKRTACGGRAFTGGDMNRFVSMYVCMYVRRMKSGLYDRRWGKSVMSRSRKVVSATAL